MVLKTFKENKILKETEKNKGHTKEFRSDDPSTYLTNVDQQKSMLLDTIDDAKVKPKIKKDEPIEMPEIISVPRSRDMSNKYFGRLDQPIKKVESYNIRPQTPVGLSKRFTQDRLREGQILKQLDREMAIESERLSLIHI